MMRKLKGRFAALISGLIIVALLDPSQRSEAATVFTDRTLWEADLGGAATITNDPFDNDIDDADSIALDSGVLSMNSGGTRSALTNRVFGGGYQNAVDGDGISASATVQWTFPVSIFAFGANWFGPGLLTVTGDFDGMGARTINFSDSITIDGFLGIVGLASFDQITFATESPTATEFFEADDLSFSSRDSAPNPVPLPPTLPLLATGLGALGLLGWWRKRKSAV